MLEQEWLSSTDPQAMLDYLNGMEQSLEMPGKKYFMHKPIATDRKLRLLCHALMAPLEPISDDYPKLPDQWLIGWFGPKVQEPEQVAHLLRLIFGNPFRRVEFTLRCKVTNNRVGTDTWGPVGCHCPSCEAFRSALIAYDTRDASLFGPLWDALETAKCDNEEIRHALAWEGRCAECLGTGTTGPSWDGEDSSYLCSCGTGWVRLPGETMMARGFWVLDVLLGKG